MLREHTLFRVIDITAKFQQKARKSILVCLVQLWYMRGKTFLGLGRRKKTEEMNIITAHPSLGQRLRDARAFKILTAL